MSVINKYCLFLETQGHIAYKIWCFYKEFTTSIHRVKYFFIRLHSERYFRKKKKIITIKKKLKKKNSKLPKFDFNQNTTKQEITI